MHRANQATFSPDFGGQPASHAMSADAAWAAAVAQLDHSLAEQVRRDEVSEAAMAAVWADAPVPDILKDEHGLPCTSEHLIERAKVPLARKLEMFAAYQEWRPRYDAAVAAHRAEEIEFPPIYEMEGRLIDTPAPDAVALTRKLSVVLSRIAQISEHELNTVDGLSEVLSSQEPAESDLARVYQDALRLAGLRQDLVDAKPFDVEGWIAQFEAIPGHVVTQRGVEYIEPQAWGAPAHGDILITEPAAIARYESYVRSRFNDAEWERYVAENPNRALTGKPITVADRSQIERAYPDGGPDAERLFALWEERRRVWREPPVGAHLWRDLPSWKKEVVRAYARRHPQLFPEGGNWTAEVWIDAYESNGGTLTVQPDGSVYMGAPLPTPPTLQRLMNICTGPLRLQVEYAVKEVAAAVEAAHANATLGIAAE